MLRNRATQTVGNNSRTLGHRPEDRCSLLLMNPLRFTFLVFCTFFAHEPTKLKDGQDDLSILCEFKRLFAFHCRQKFTPALNKKPIPSILNVKPPIAYFGIIIP